jgi:signal transduction histidine kinase
MKKVLYVEDSPESRLLVSRILTAHGYRVIEVEDGLSAIQRAQEEVPDLILMDINIPGMDGFEVTTRLRSIPALKNVPIVALTASAVMEGDRERTLVAGCDGYLQKPVDVDRLPQQVREFIEGKKEVVEREEEPVYLREYSQRLVARLEEKISELQRANEQLQALDRLKSDFLSTVSHELRTPLTAIKGYTQLLMDRRAGPLTDMQAECLNVIAENTEIVIRRVNDILFLQESNVILPVRVPLSLRDVVIQIVDAMRERAQKAGIEFVLDIPPDLPPILGDVEALKLLFLHLLDNAIKFSPYGGQVTITLRDRGTEIWGEVSDTGIGIAPEYHERIFERFFQVDSSTTRAYGGAGLGLAISRKILEAHGGRIGVLRSAPGQGSTFYFSIPKG